MQQPSTVCSGKRNAAGNGPGGPTHPCRLRRRRIRVFGFQTAIALAAVVSGAAPGAPRTQAARERFVQVDLAPVANRSHMQSPYYSGETQDYRWLRPGVHRIRLPGAEQVEIPFNILDPRRNAGRSILVTRGIKNRFPTCFRIPVYETGVRRVYVLGLAGGWASGPPGAPVAELLFQYDGGPVFRRVLRRGFEVDDWTHHTAWAVPQVLRSPDPGDVGHLDLLTVELPSADRRRMLTTIELRSVDSRTSVPVFAVTLDVAGPGTPLAAKSAVLRRDLNRRIGELQKAAASLRERGLEPQSAEIEKRLHTVVTQCSVIQSADSADFARLVRASAELQELERAVERLRYKVVFTRVPDAGARTFPGPDDYMTVLNRFVRWAERGVHSGYRGNADLAWFGSGANDENGQRPLGNFIFVYSVLAVDPRYSAEVSGVPRERIIEHARAALRFMTRTHVTGDLPCTNGRPWGDHWQSAWWAAKLAAGAWLLRTHGLLPDDQWNGVRRVVVHEADRLLPVKPPSGVRYDTKAEENAWDSEILAWASGMFPDHPRAAAWDAKARELSMNTLSTAADRTDRRMADGRPVCEQVFTENVHPDFTIENHGAYHFCYMACPLHSLTWTWYAYTSTGRPPPEAVFHHFRDVWNVIRQTALLRHGRFAYLSGKDWARYVYGLYFIMPALVLLQNEFGDRDARLLERLRFQTFEWEQRRNGDGGFYTDRFTQNVMTGWPSEYETDTACMLALCHRLHRGRPLIAPADSADFVRRMQGVRVSPFCEWVFARSEQAFASFSWRTLDRRHQLGLFIPAGRSDMAEWAPGNMLGRIRASGRDLTRQKTCHRENTGPRGFVTFGYIDRGVREGGPAAVRQYLCFAAFPKSGLAVLVDRCVALDRIRVAESAALDLRVPNDIFNGCSRRVFWEGGEALLPGGDASGRVLQARSSWLNLDDALGIVCIGNREVTVHSPDGRNAPWSSLRLERICWAERTQARWFAPGEEIRRLAFVLIAGDRRRTREAASAARMTIAAAGECIAVKAPTGSGPLLLVAVNFGEKPCAMSLGEVRVGGGPEKRRVIPGTGGGSAVLRVPSFGTVTAPLLGP